MRRLAALALCLGGGSCLLAGCGYALSTRWGGRGGVEKVEVAELENRSTEPGLGAVLTGALRAGLARRGAEGPAAGEGRRGAVLSGEVRAKPAAPSSAEARTWRASVEVRVKLARGAEVVAERTFQREADYLGGADPVEAEGRRALALRRLADELAAEILAAFER
jgi:hypothetical protein